jgi:hypothetical protein
MRVDKDVLGLRRKATNETDHAQNAKGHESRTPAQSLMLPGSHRACCQMGRLVSQLAEQREDWHSLRPRLRRTLAAQRPPLCSSRFRCSCDCDSSFRVFTDELSFFLIHHLLQTSSLILAFTISSLDIFHLEPLLRSCSHCSANRHRRERRLPPSFPFRAAQSPSPIFRPKEIWITTIPQIDDHAASSPSSKFQILSEVLFHGLTAPLRMPHDTGSRLLCVFRRT